MIQKYPDYMMKILRQRRGLNENDCSEDREIEIMNPISVVEECAAWILGDSAWANIFIQWIEDTGSRVIWYREPLQQVFWGLLNNVCYFR